MRLPGGFSPLNALREAADTVNPFNGNKDYDVFGGVAFRGGDRSPANGAFVGTQYTPPKQSSGSGGGGGGWGTTTNQTSDPYAQYGGQSAYNSMVNNFDEQLENAYGSVDDATRSAGRGFRSNILDFLESVKTGQKAIDERGIQSDLARLQGRNSILDMVGRGIRSGGVQLANRNASDSSAAGAMARAYGEIGSRDMSKLGNQYELENRNIGMEQENLGTQMATGKRKLSEARGEIVDRIVFDARNQLAALDAAMAEASLPDKIEIDAEKERIKGEVMDYLSKYDAELSRGLSQIRPQDAEARRRAAQELAYDGVEAGNQFNFSDVVPAEFQGTGPFASELPIFTLSRQRRLE